MKKTSFSAGGPNYQGGKLTVPSRPSAWAGVRGGIHARILTAIRTSPVREIAIVMRIRSSTIPSDHTSARSADKDTLGGML